MYWWPALFIHQYYQLIAKLSSSYKPNYNNQLDYDILVRASDDEEQQNVFSSVVGNTNQLENAKPYNINQSLNYKKLDS